MLLPRGPSMNKSRQCLTYESLVRASSNRKSEHIIVNLMLLNCYLITISFPSLIQTTSGGGSPAVSIIYFYITIKTFYANKFCMTCYIHTEDNCDAYCDAPIQCWSSAKFWPAHWNWTLLRRSCRRYDTFLLLPNRIYL